MNRGKPKSLLTPKLLAVSVAACFALNAAPLRANPNGPSVVHGSVGFNGLGTSALTITNQAGGNAIINWNGFSIGINELTKFQQFANLAVLNRVTGSDISSILGALQSDGRVFLINPNGIVFGASARIDVAGMVASSLNLSDQDFLAGRLRFTEVPGAGAVVNNGIIETASGGRVYLVAPTVENNGLVHTPQGAIVLAAGKEVELVDAASPFVTVKVAADEHAVNVGKLVAESGQIGMFGALVTTTGVVEAGGAQVGPGGEIRLVAARDLTLDAGSVVSANGTSGGKVLLQAEGGTNLVGGTVEARGNSGRGGEVSALGVRVGVVGHGVIDASGDNAGGTVLVGGDYQGGNAAVQNAQRTYIGSDGVIRADAMTAGDGGRVVVWADGDTSVSGALSARGGSQSGNGGFVETSGKQSLSVAGSRVDTRAPAGYAGSWLLDPSIYDITSAEAAAIESNFASNGNVTVSADVDINFQSSLNLSYGALTGFFSAYAGNNINLGAFNITGSGARGSNMILSANDGGVYGGASGVGQITSAPGGGNITTGGGGFAATGIAVSLGNINSNATGLAGTSGGGNVFINSYDGAVNTGSIATGGGSIDLIANAIEGNATVMVGGPINTSNVYGYLGDNSGNGAVNIQAEGNIVTGSITTASTHPGFFQGGNVTLAANTGTVVVNGNIDARGANGSNVGFNSSYYGGTSGGSVHLRRDAQDGFGGTAVQVNGSVLTGGGSGLSVATLLGANHAGGSGGEVFIWADTCRDDCPGQLVGGVAVTGAIDSSGGNGGNVTQSSSNTAGGGGGQIYLYATGAVSVGTLSSRGGNGGNGSDGWSYDNRAGWGGPISVFTTGGTINIGSVNASGGNGGNAGSPLYGGGSIGGLGGSGGFTDISGGAAVSIGSITARGGVGGIAGNGLGAQYAYGGDGGDGSSVYVSSSTGVSIGAVDNSGAHGGAGGVATDSAWGGSGGNGGFLRVVGTDISIGSIIGRGGNGGTGGSISNGDGNADGGWGGWGGNVWLDTTSSRRIQEQALVQELVVKEQALIEVSPSFTFSGGPITTGLINVSAGNGGNSGAVGSSFTQGGAGGGGGDATLIGSTINVAGPILAKGGNGGIVMNASLPPSQTLGTPVGGAGGSGGVVWVYGLDKVQINVGGALGALAIDTSGGAGGSGNPATSPAGNGGAGGSGGSANVVGTPSMTLFGSINAAGGAGGPGGAGSLSIPGGNGGSGGFGGSIFLDASSITESNLGDGLIFVLAGAQFNVQGGLGGSGGANGGSPGVSGNSNTFIKGSDYFGSIVVLDPLSIPEVNQANQQTAGSGATAFVGGEKPEEEEDKSQKELASCKG